MEKRSRTSKIKVADEPQAEPEKGRFFIVGIGASAGGIQALQEFFNHVPTDSNIAYVVILHLSPDHDSKLASILQKQTTLPVAQVNKKVKISPNHIYVVPPNKHLTMEDGHIAVSLNLQIEERRAPVDIFFRTLAEEHGTSSIAVILSGTGANGSMGMKRIKEKGGACFVQNPREAEFNEMPRNSIATGMVDDILPVADIPAKIVSYIKSLGVIEITKDPEKRPEEEQVALREIFTQLKVRTRHDFSNYKRPTLLRRIERRMSIHNLVGLAAYSKFLREQPEEPSALLKDLLISVTNFFRDKKPFDLVEKEILPAMLEGKTGGDNVRIWVAGCATGEEAYSLAMICAEKISGLVDAPRLQIFATDIDESAIAKAREGLYTLNDAADVSPDRLRRFFNKEGDAYRIRREIREMILFANHNFLKDPPFSHLDMISCRNVMIYFNQVAQERVVETFHFALKPAAYLLLGSSESINGASDLYAVYNREQHIFQSRQAAPRSYPIPDSTPSLYFDKIRKDTEFPEQEKEILNRISFGDLHQQLLEAYAPPSLVVNEQFEILHLTEKVGRYLQVGGGEVSHNLFKMVKPELRLELRSALYQAVQHQLPVEARGLKMKFGDKTEIINVHIRPVIKMGDTAKGLILIVFEPDVAENNPGIRLASDESLAKQLEEELIRVKMQLRTSGEQHDFQAEEMKASNEELQAMNEELRSAAEELETSKEELQSINEELRTVNQELKVKIEETSITSNNLHNLIGATDIGTIFLDRSLRVALYTPAATAIFHLIPADFGRPLSDIASRLEDDDILIYAEAVLEKLQPLEKDVHTKDDRIFLMRITPYRTDDDRINGVVLSFVDLTESRRTEEALRIAEEKYRIHLEKQVEQRTKDLAGMQRLYDLNNRLAIITDFKAALEEIIAVACGFVNTDRGCIQLVSENSERLEMFAYKGFNESDRFIQHFLHEGSRAACDETGVNRRRLIIEDVENSSSLLSSSVREIALSDGIHAAQATPIFNRSGELLGVLSNQFRQPTHPDDEQLKQIDLLVWMAGDYIQQHNVSKELQMSEQRLRVTTESAVDFVIITMNRERLVEQWNTGATHTLGFTAEEMKGEPADIIFTDEDRANGVPEQEVQNALNKGYAEDERWHQRKDGSRFFMSGVVRPIYNPELTGFVKVARDITRQKDSEQQLRVLEERNRIALQSAEMASWDLNVQDDKVTWNEQHYTLLGAEPDQDQKTTAYFLQFVHPDERDKVEKALRVAVEDGGIYKAEFRIKRRDNNEVRWMTGFGRAIEWNDNKVTRMVGVMYDITERKNLEQQKEDFLNIASHELKTPVTSIKAYGEMLEQSFEENDNPESVSLVQKLNVQVDRLNSLISDLLDTTKIAEGQLPLAYEDLNMCTLINQLVEEFQQVSKKHSLVSDCDGQIHVHADKKRIEQVVTNLLSNAIKYSPNGGQVTVSCELYGEQVKVSVADQGIGIPEKLQDKLFNRFFRVRSGISGTLPGMGLGLYITSGIIKRHGGTLGLKSDPGKGSVFYFTLPRTI